MLNKATILGRLGADPDSKTISNGNTVTKMSIATSESWTDRDGQKQERTEWHNVVVWNELAVHCERYLKKGSLVYLHGPIHTRSWEDQKGVKRYTTEIIAKVVKFLDPKESRSSNDIDFNSKEELPF